MKKFFLILFFLILLVPLVHSYAYSQYQGRCFPSGNITVYETSNTLVANVTKYNFSGIMLSPGCYLTLARFNVPDTTGGLPFLTVGEQLTFYINGVKANTTPSIVTWTGTFPPAINLNISTCVDNDNDHFWVSNFGVCGVNDCDDTNQYIFPANTNTNCTCPSDVKAEVCDGKDNNCDGIADNGLPILCSSNSDCGINYCNNITNLYYNFSCINPGTCHSYCSNTTTPMNCTIPITCSANSDCGTNFCDNITNLYYNFSCINLGTPSSYCSNSTTSMNCSYIPPPPPPQPCNHNHICEPGEGCTCSDCFGQACSGGFCSSNENCKSNCTIVSGESLVLFDLFPFAKKTPSNLNIYVETFDYWILDKYGNMLPVEVGIKSW